jgi:kojibiose phosphorylase
MLVRTIQSGLQVAEAARQVLSCAARTAPADSGRRTGRAFRFDARRGVPVTLEKVVAIHNSVREADPLAAAQAEAAAAPAFAELEREHAAAWAGYWTDCDVEIRGDRFVQTMARFWVFQLLQAASLNNVKLNLSASIPAKTLSGWGYGGRVFWDTEMYMLPFFSQEFPEIARSLLMYRHDRLGAARRLAARSGCSGAKFPWESTATGIEECPNWTPLKPGTGRWERWRGGEQQIHVNADVAFGFWRHCLATGDRKLLAGPGLDVLVGTARYWASRVRERSSGGEAGYEIRWVIGPDESHQCVHNNVYTNAMARWNLRAAAELVESLRRRPGAHRTALRRLGLRAGEPERWRHIAGRIRINFDPATGLYEQFDGYFRHPEQTVKQADTLLALYLLPELRPGNVFRRNFERYSPVTEHGSSLSPCMHALFALELGDERKAYEYALQSCAVDGVYAPGGSDKGLHAAALGGGWSMLVAGFGGVRVTPECLEVAPRLPSRWRRLAFSIRYRGLRLRFRIEPRRLVIQADPAGRAVKLRVLGEPLTMKPGRRIERRIGSNPRPSRAE